jgi:hypothetical protein
VPERGDDGALDVGWEEGLETEGAHAADEGGMILLVAGAAAGDAAFGFPFVEGLMEGQEGMGGRGIAELPGFLEALPLSEEIEA